MVSENIFVSIELNNQAGTLSPALNPGLSTALSTHACQKVLVILQDKVFKDTHTLTFGHSSNVSIVQYECRRTLSVAINNFEDHIAKKRIVPRDDVDVGYAVRALTRSDQPISPFESNVQDTIETLGFVYVTLLPVGNIFRRSSHEMICLPLL